MSRDWTTPPFDSLPALLGSPCRWVGSQVMDEEQYRLERWECSTRKAWDFSGPTPKSVTATYWRASIVGMGEYGDLRGLRRADRKAAWQARQEADDEWSRHVAQMVEATG